jgi:outer membrane protein assembly factor BamB
MPARRIFMQTKKAPFFTFLMITLMAMGTAQTAWGDWVARYDDPTAQADNARAVAVDSEGNVIVTGESQGPKSKSAYVTVKYAPDGSEIWVNRYEGPGKGNHKACGIALDSAGNILVTGSSMGLRTRSDLLTLKYDRNGNTLWERRFNAAKNGGDMARSIAVDAEDSVYVAGLAGSRSILLIKYASYGQELWAREYKPRKSGVDPVPSMGIDSDGNVYLVGTEKWTGWRYRILVLKYSGAGELVWKSPYAVVSGRDNSPKAMTVDAGGQVHVAGVQSRSEISVYFLLK